MPRFNIGDRVIRTGPPFGGVNTGDIGTVIYVAPDYQSARVEFTDQNRAPWNRALVTRHLALAPDGAGRDHPTATPPELLFPPGSTAIRSQRNLGGIPPGSRGLVISHSEHGPEYRRMRWLVPDDDPTIGARVVTINSHIGIMEPPTNRAGEQQADTQTAAG